jgi:hypothetical protein
LTLKGEARTSYMRDYMRRRREAERAGRAGNRIRREAALQTGDDVTRLQAENATLKDENATLKKQLARLQAKAELREPSRKTPASRMMPSRPPPPWVR